VKAGWKIGSDYYHCHLAVEHQAGRLSEQDRCRFGIGSGDLIELVVFCGNGRTDEVVGIVTAAQGRVVARYDNRLTAKVPIPTLLAFEQSPRRLHHQTPEPCVE
jgi:hypothetical protein